MSKICLIFNPAARGDKARRLSGLLAQFGKQAELKPTVSAGSARGQATEAVSQGFTTIVAAGGDGTVNEVLNGIADDSNGLEQVRLGVLPMGTINVFAAELGIPFNLQRAWELILRGRETLVDLPSVSYALKGIESKRLFVQLAGAGFDARAVELVDWEWKKKIGQAAYILAGLHALRSEHPTISITHDHGRTTGELVLIGNGRFYGGKFPFFHRAQLADGVFDVCVFPKVHWSLLPRYGWALVSGQIFKPGATEYFQTKTLELAASSQAAIQLEGEAVGHLPARIELLSQRLRVLVP